MNSTCVEKRKGFPTVTSMLVTKIGGNFPQAKCVGDKFEMLVTDLRC